MSETFKTIEQAEEYLLRLAPSTNIETSYSLDRIRRLMEFLGNPQNDIAAVHVAGTSGKTSTANYIRNLLEALGVRTGLTTSPHISSITERVQVDGAPLNDQAFLRYLESFLKAIAPYEGTTPTYFEFMTAFAYWVFKQAGVDYMVIEVGLGGLLDATNVIDTAAKVSVITPLGLDHTQILGDTIEQIAFQKAGIILPGSDVFMAHQDDAAARVVKLRAVEQHARLHDLEEVPYQSIALPLFQQENFHLARTVVSFIAERDGLTAVSQDEIKTSMWSTPPGRYEVHEINGRTVILDGAHNPQKLTALIQSLQQHFSGPYTWLVGFASAPDHKIEACVKVIANQNDKFFATDFPIGQDTQGRRCVESSVIQTEFARHGIDDVAVYSDPEAAFAALLGMKQRTVVVTGSLYLVAQVRHLLLRQERST